MCLPTPVRPAIALGNIGHGRPEAIEALEAQRVSSDIDLVETVHWALEPV